MASAPGSERRPRTLRRVVRRLATVRWPGRPRPGSGAARGPAVAADIAAGLPVRASWTLLRRWWRRWSRRADPPATGNGAIGGAPAMLRGSPARSRAATGRGLPGTLALRLPATVDRRGPGRAPLGVGPVPGPQVHPGHDLVLRPPLGIVSGDHRWGGDSPPTARGAAGHGRGVHGNGSAAPHGGAGPHGRAGPYGKAGPHGGAGLHGGAAARGAVSGTDSSVGRASRSGSGHPDRRGAGDGAAYREGPLGVRPLMAWTGHLGRRAATPGPVHRDRSPDGFEAHAETTTHGPGDGRGTGSPGRAVPGPSHGLATGRRPVGARSLVAPHVPGPSVRNPESALDLPVLGGAAMPPGTQPDPSGVVSASRLGGRGLLGGYAAPVPENADPRARWEAAVAARPLEAPRQLPGALHAMASALTGRARPPLFTTGPATRQALAAAGARGATTGTVVHLPEAPPNVPAMSEVLAHELMHTRSPVRRPRFLLERASGLLDDDERQALAAGRQRLADAGSGLLGAGRQAGEGLLVAGGQRLADAAPAAAGIVDQLPVGGGLGAVGDVATRAARAAVLEATSGPMARLTGAAGEAADAAAGAMTSAGGVVSDAASAATGAVDAAAGAVSGAAGQAVSTVAGGAVGAAKAALDPDKVVEIVEARLLREIERRGGRWAGVF
ncbi:DUF4157 domain-containing protein [Krasilnikovia sp. MM14-A1259]|uniref:eCIS core domain-containing protein n=1 Tax=Krasilnikovia sp. MM14-A1259 TaxID=3373539 RepID=UPI003824E72F